MIEVSEGYLAFGKNNFVKEVAIPVGEVIEVVAKEYPCVDEVELKIAPQATAFLSELDALIGVSLFLGGWASTKFLDEIYDAKLGPGIKKYFKEYIDKNGANKKYSIAIMARRKEISGVVLICCVGSSIEEIESSERHIPSALGIAEKILEPPVGKSVYLYVIESGRVTLEPKAFDSIEGALEGLKRMCPAKLPRNINL